MRLAKKHLFALYSLTVFGLGFLLVSCGPSQVSQTPVASASPSLSSEIKVTAMASHVSIAFLEGSASIEHQGQTNPAAIGDLLYPADIISTGAASSVELDSPQIGKIVIKANTKFRLDSVSSDGHRLLATDLSGQIVARAKKLTSGDSFIVKTPVAACGVRGTIFLVSVAAGGASSFAVREGVVALFPNTAVDKGWLTTSTGEGNYLDIAKFPQVGAGQKQSIQPGNAKLVALESKLSQSEPAVPDQALSDALPWLQSPPQQLNKEDKALLEIEPTALATPSTPPTTTPAASASTVDLFAGDPNNNLWVSPIAAPKIKTDTANPWNFDAPYSQAPADAKPSTNYQIYKDIEFLSFFGAKGKLSLADKTPQIELSQCDGQIQNAGMVMRSTYAMEKGMLYKLSFTAWADKPARIVADLHEDNRDLNQDGLMWTAYKPWFYQALSKTPTRYSTYFTNLIGNDNGARLTFQVGETAAKYYVQDAVLEKIGKAPDSGADNQIPNGDFRYGFMNWRPSDWKNNQARFSCADGIFTFYPVSKPANFWDIQLIAPKVKIVKDKYYLIDFDAQCDAPVTVGMAIQEDNRDLNKDGDAFSQEIRYLELPLLSSWRHFQAKVKAKTSDDLGTMVFNIGAATKPLRFANITFREAK